MGLAGAQVRNRRLVVAARESDPCPGVQEPGFGTAAVHRPELRALEQHRGLFQLAPLDQRLAEEAVRVGGDEMQAVRGRELHRRASVGLGRRDQAAAQRDRRSPSAGSGIAHHRAALARVNNNFLEHTIGAVELVDERERPRGPRDLDRLGRFRLD